MTLSTLSYTVVPQNIFDWPQEIKSFGFISHHKTSLFCSCNSSIKHWMFASNISMKFGAHGETVDSKITHTSKLTLGSGGNILLNLFHGSEWCFDFFFRACEYEQYQLFFYFIDILFVIIRKPKEAQNLRLDVLCEKRPNIVISI